MNKNKQRLEGRGESENRAQGKVQLQNSDTHLHWFRSQKKHWWKQTKKMNQVCALYSGYNYSSCFRQWLHFPCTGCFYQRWCHADDRMYQLMHKAGTLSIVRKSGCWCMVHFTWVHLPFFFKKNNFCEKKNKPPLLAFFETHACTLISLCTCAIGSKWTIEQCQNTAALIRDRVG